MSLLNHMEEETIAEVGNISLGAAANALSLIINRRVYITAPHVQELTVQEIRRGFPVPCLLAESSYQSGLRGDNILIMKQDDAMAIASLMMGGRGEGFLGEMELSAIQEAMNQMTGYMATSMSEMFGQVIEISPPKLTICNLAEKSISGMEDEILAVQISFSIQVEGLIDSKLIQVVPLEFARRMAKFLLSGGGTALETEPEKTLREGEQPPPPLTAGTEDEIFAEPGSATEQFEKAEEAAEVNTPREKSVSDQWGKLDMVKEIPLEITVYLGKTRIPLGNLFTLGQGGIICLDQLAGEAVEILINDKPIAKGEVVLINEQFGVKITNQILMSG